MQQAVETFRTIRGTKEETANAKARAELKVTNCLFNIKRSLEMSVIIRLISVKW